MQSATASGTCPDILNSHSHLLMKDILHLILNRFSPRNHAVAWSHDCAGGPGPNSTQFWYMNWTSPCSYSASTWCCGVEQKQGLSWAYKGLLFSGWLLAPSLAPGKSVYMMQNQSGNCLDSVVPVE